MTASRAAARPAALDRTGAVDRNRWSVYRHLEYLDRFDLPRVLAEHMCNRRRGRERDSARA